MPDLMIDGNVVVSPSEAESVMLFRSLQKALRETRDQLEQPAALEDQCKKLEEAIERCEDEKELKKLLDSLSALELKSRVAKIKNRRLTEELAETRNSLLQAAHGVVRSLTERIIPEVLQLSYDVIVQFFNATVDPLSREMYPDGVLVGNQRAAALEQLSSHRIGFSLGLFSRGLQDGSSSGIPPQIVIENVSNTLDKIEAEWPAIIGDIDRLARACKAGVTILTSKQEEGAARSPRGRADHGA